MVRSIRAGDFAKISSIESVEGETGKIYIITSIVKNPHNYEIAISTDDNEDHKIIIINSTGTRIQGMAKSVKIIFGSSREQLEIQPGKTKLKIITFNLAGNAQTNIVAGSEAILVKQCHQRYPQYKGWSSPRSNPQSKDKIILSQCTLNAANWMASKTPTLIGLQENVSYYLPEITSVINKETGKSYKSIGYSTTQFIYNEEILGPGELLSPPHLYIIQQGRSMIIVWFSKIKLLAINLHAPHNVNLNRAVTETFESVSLSVSPNRIIVTGDFNDAYYTPLTEITLMGKLLKQHEIPPRSCCTDTDYRLVGDYIFDSDYNAEGFYGIPEEALLELMSDHHPVMYNEF